MWAAYARGQHLGRAWVAVGAHDLGRQPAAGAGRLPDPLLDLTVGEDLVDVGRLPTVGEHVLHIEGGWAVDAHLDVMPRRPAGLSNPFTTEVHAPEEGHRPVGV